MKKLTLLTLAFALVALPAVFVQAGACQEDVTVHGTVRFIGFGGGCWQFQGDDNVDYELVTNKRNILKDGITGVLHGDMLDGPVASTCRVGVPTEVCSFDADNARGGAGTLFFSPCLEGGCWIFTIGGTNYQPFSQDSSFYEHNAHIQVQFLERPDIGTFCQVGPVIEILDFTILQEGEETPTCGGGPIVLE